MSKSSKQAEKIASLGILWDVLEDDARVLAKKSKVIRIKRKINFLVGPSRRVLGSLNFNGEKMQMILPAGTTIEQEGNVLSFTFPAEAKAKKKKVVDKNEPIK